MSKGRSAKVGVVSHDDGYMLERGRRIGGENAAHEGIIREGGLIDGGEAQQEKCVTTGGRKYICSLEFARVTQRDHERG